MSTTTPLRHQVYSLLILVALGIVCARILGANRSFEPYYYRDDPGKSVAAVLLPMGAGGPLEAAALYQGGHATWGLLDPREMRPVWPKTRPDPTLTFGANDRSRWDTIRALVEESSYVIGYREIDPETEKYRDYGISREPEWGTIDRVLRPEPDPERPNTYRFYSSKPPLLPTLLAGEYGLLYHVLGLKLADPQDRWWVVRIILLTAQALPLLLYLILLSRLVERYGVTDWGRLFVVAAACFGTFLTLFATALNNHVIAACTALFALYPALSIGDALGKDQETAENRDTGAEESSTSLSSCLPVSLSPCLFLTSGFFAAFTAAIELPATAFAVFLFLLLLWRAPKPTLRYFLPAAAVPVAAFFLTNYLAIGRLTPAYGEFGGPWYEYPGSVWRTEPGKEKRGIDSAGTKEDRATYATNFLIGHHGVFALTPIYVLALAGMGWGLYRLGRTDPLPPEGSSRGGADRISWRMLAGLSAALTVVVIGFYLWQTTNYGGWTNGPRWLFWLTPFWLLCLLPVIDYLAAHRWGRTLALALLAVSIFSANYRDWNPWRHPWIYQFFDSQNWIPY